MEDYEYHLSRFHREYARRNFPDVLDQYDRMHEHLKVLEQGTDEEAVDRIKESICRFIRVNKLKGVRKPEAGPAFDPFEHQAERQEQGDLASAYSPPRPGTDAYDDLMRLEDPQNERDRPLRRGPSISLGTRYKLGGIDG